MRRRTLLALPFALPVAFPAVFFSEASAQRPPFAVATSFNAVSEIVRAVAGEAVRVTELIPDKTEPHDFTPTLKTLKTLKTVDILVTAGNGMEPWADAAARASGVKHAFQAAQGFGSANEPHTWLAPEGARFMAKAAARELSRLHPEWQAVFINNLETFDAALAAIEALYGKRFAAAPRKTFVTGHAAFGALCTQFGLVQESVEDVFAHGEPTVKKLAELSRWCRDHSVRTVFSEEMASPAVSETLAREAGARVVPIFTMESSEDGSPFLSRMKANLERIAVALEE